MTELMQQKGSNQIQLFKSLLKRMYEKGEKEKNLSTKAMIEDMEVELRSILSKKII